MGFIHDTKGPVTIETRSVASTFKLIAVSAKDGVYTAPGEQVSIEMDLRHLDALIDDLQNVRRVLHEKNEGNDGHTTKPLRTRRERVEAARMRIQQRIAEKRASRPGRSPYTPVPIYDEVYFRGVAWLNGEDPDDNKGAR